MWVWCTVSVCVYVCLSLCLYPFVWLFITRWVSLCLSVCQCVSVCLCVCLCVCLSVSVCPPVMSVYLSVCLSLGACCQTVEGLGGEEWDLDGCEAALHSLSLPGLPPHGVSCPPEGPVEPPWGEHTVPSVGPFKAQLYLFLVSLLLFVDITIILKPSKSKIWYLKTSAVS